MRHLLLALPLLALSFNNQAADSVNVDITGKLISPVACSLDNGSGTVDLGDILASKIDGIEYQKPLGVSLNCTGWNSQEKVEVTLTGANATGNKLPISGDAEGFDLALTKGGTAQDFGIPFEVKADGDLGLNIVPVINGDTPAPGAFTATATATVAIS